MLTPTRQVVAALTVIACAQPNALGETPWAPAKEAGALRIAAFNVLDYPNLMGDAARTARLAEVVRHLDADILLLNEVAFDANNPAGNAEALIAPLGTPRYEVFAAPVNTGVPSGFDLNNDGAVVTEPGSRAYGGDCFGYGTFEGQYGMALLVRKDIGSIDREGVRTFRQFRWKDMPGALIPDGWYSDDELAVFRLSSKSHWDVPVRLRNGGVIHILASHPTPAIFDGSEDRNGRRNHDEIRFWSDYISGGERASYIVDDLGARGGLAPGTPDTPGAPEAHFVILGDLNADPAPERGEGRKGAITNLLNHPRVQRLEPRAEGSRASIARQPDGQALPRPIVPTDTATFALRADYALPSVTLDVIRTGTVREESPEGAALFEPVPGAPWWLELFPSDHFPVYVDVRIPE